MGVWARYQELSTYSNIQEMGHIHLLVLVCSTVLAVTLAEDPPNCKDQHDTYQDCIRKNHAESVAKLTAHDDDRKDFWERKVCNLLEKLMDCFDALEEDCQGENIKASLSATVNITMNATETDENWKPDLCKITKRIEMDIFGDATRLAKEKQDEDETQKSAADANVADANAADGTAAADASATVVDDNGEATTPAAPTTTQDPNSGLVSCPTAIHTFISVLLTLAIRT